LTCVFFQIGNGNVAVSSTVVTIKPPEIIPSSHSRQNLESNTDLIEPSTIIHKTNKFITTDATYSSYCTASCSAGTYCYITTPVLSPVYSPSTNCQVQPSLRRLLNGAMGFGLASQAECQIVRRVNEANSKEATEKAHGTYMNRLLGSSKDGQDKQDLLSPTSEEKESHEARQLVSVQSAKMVVMSTTCYLCPTGYSCPDGSQYGPCNAGYYTTDSITCVPCAAGTYQGYTGMSSCASVAAGKSLLWTLLWNKVIILFRVCTRLRS
jgi:hypothetical protein